VTIERKMVRRITAIVIAGILLFVPASVQPCQKVDISEDTCCCCETSGQLSQPDDTKQHECPCQISESQPVESSPAVIISHHKRAPEPLLLAAEIEGPTENYLAPFAGLNTNYFLLLSRDPPLYLLNSSFLI